MRSLSLLPAVLILLCSSFLISPSLGDMWEGCATIPDIGDACIEVDYETTNLTATITFTIAGHQVLQQSLSAGSVCLDQDTLLLLITEIPALEEYAPEIKKIISAGGLIPVDVFSICLVTSGVTFTPSFNACFAVDSTLMCFFDKCLYKGVNDLGCA
eukprot:TRINITY_DN7497_c0_g1_i2.p1 TRINITY_DN7497_c0_g1~~TRINITY_DN7497_c0_g1_i2.p1  ORF type:complete len:183 (-),score=12.89 TRINITY_DN7497_c0_g1_i2:105-575(-)